MEKSQQGTKFEPGVVMGMLVAAAIIALALIGKILILELGGPVFLATAIQVGANLVAAGVMEVATRSRGTVIAATAILIAATLVPLLWVADGSQWLRENPINAGILIILASFIIPLRQVRWPVYTVALILGAATIIVSFI